MLKARDSSHEYHGQRVAFRNAHDKPIGLPDREILALHRAFAGVLRLSGAAEYLDTTWQEMEETHALSADGSTDISALLTTGMQKLVSSKRRDFGITA